MNEIKEYSEMGDHYRVEVLRHWIRDDFEYFELKIIEVLAKSEFFISGEVGEIFEVSRLVDGGCANGWQLF